MHRILNLISILLMTSCPLILNAQDNELVLRLRGGHNSTYGGFAAVSLETDQTISSRFSISGGLQYNTIGRTALEVRPVFGMDHEWGRLSAEAIFSYTNLASIKSFSAGAGGCIDFRNITAKLGYYYRLYGGSGGRIAERFNIYYELRVHLFEKIRNWKMYLSITNNEIFELERHYQPSFIAECFYYPTAELGVSLGIGCKPAGMFNLSADYYQSFIKTGICYRW